MTPRLLPVTIAAASVMLALKASSLAFGDSKQGANMQTMPPKPTVNQNMQPLASSDMSLSNLGGVVTGQIAQNPAISEQLREGEDPRPKVVGESLLAGKATYKSDPNNPIYRNDELLSAAELEAAESNSEAKAALVERMREREASRNASGGANSTQQKLLLAAEAKLTDRIQELKEAEEQLGQALMQKDAEKEAQFAGVVKMYESMKPKNAARIFNTLEMSVLLDVAKRIKPRIMAEIMANMEPVSAQALTVALARGWDGDNNGDAPAQMNTNLNAGSMNGSLNTLPKIGG